MTASAPVSIPETSQPSTGRISVFSVPRISHEKAADHSSRNGEENEMPPGFSKQPFRDGLRARMAHEHPRRERVQTRTAFPPQPLRAHDRACLRRSPRKPFGAAFPQPKSHAAQHQESRRAIPIGSQTAHTVRSHPSRPSPAAAPATPAPADNSPGSRTPGERWSRSAVAHTR